MANQSRRKASVPRRLRSEAARAIRERTTRPAEAHAAAVAMIDRLVRHAEILALKGDSYRLRDKDLRRSRPHA